MWLVPEPFNLVERTPDDLFELFNSRSPFNQFLPLDSPCNFNIPEPDPLIVEGPAAIDLPTPEVDIQPQDPATEISEPAAIDLPAPEADIQPENSATEVSESAALNFPAPVVDVRPENSSATGNVKGI